MVRLIWRTDSGRVGSFEERIGLTTAMIVTLAGKLSLGLAKLFNIL